MSDAMDVIARPRAPPTDDDEESNRVAEAWAQQHILWLESPPHSASSSSSEEEEEDEEDESSSESSEEEEPDMFAASRMPTHIFDEIWTARVKDTAKVTCGVCLAPLDKATATMTLCGHEYCLTCLEQCEKWNTARAKPNCPQCRTPFPRVI